MDGMIFVVVLVLGVTLTGVRSRKQMQAPGLLLTLLLLVTSYWYVYR